MIDRKRLRELALAAQSIKSHDWNVLQAVWDDFQNAANPQTILALLDALEARPDDARDAARYRWFRDALVEDNSPGHKNNDPHLYRAIDATDTELIDRECDAAIAERTKEQG